jgi:hypothetical protein
MYPVEEHERYLAGDDFDSLDPLSAAKGLLLGLFLSLCLLGTVLALVLVILPWVQA